ncbi:proteasome activator pa28 [Pelagophyceae sp. CCMP2097]|nr:proteasome activator pa28 [Pelagophyceae sp. CCMP2097]
MDTAAPAVNATLAELIPLVRAALAGAVLDLRKLERWIVLNVPKVEDGNNFGVAIQIDVHKMVLEHRKELKAMLDKLADYHKERAALLKEVVSAKTSSDTTETATKNDDSEAKGADASVATVKAGKSTKTETRTARSTPLPDACEAVVALDVMWYFHLGYVLEVARDAYIATGDMVQKNKLKLEQPKGDGNSRMNMF